MNLLNLNLPYKCLTDEHAAEDIFWFGSFRIDTTQKNQMQSLLKKERRNVGVLVLTHLPVAVCAHALGNNFVHEVNFLCPFRIPAFVVLHLACAMVSAVCETNGFPV